MEPWRSYATMCRLCLQKDGFMLGIFNHIHGKDKSIYKKIIDCTALQISHGDGLPNVICHRCLYKIEFCLEFRQLCFMSDATLRQITGVVTKENGDVNKNGAHLPIFEQLAGGNDEDVVMVVDPNAFDYESSYESDKDVQSEPENVENGEADDVVTESGRGVPMCKFCDHAFTDAAECLKHEANFHNTDRPYTCGSCYMTFADRVLYSAHLKNVHKNDKPYNCPQCDRTFARRSDLRKHTIVHTGVKPFTCTICYKSFSRNTNLSKHMRIHAGSKPFVCPKCPKTFTSKENLTRHAVIHSGQKPFSCNFCHLSFGRRDKLLRHEKRHLPQEEVEGGAKQAPSQDSKQKYAQNDKNGEGEIKQEGSENMVISVDPFNHNNYSGATPQRGDNSENEPHNESQEQGYVDRIKLEDLENPEIKDTQLTGENVDEQEKNDVKLYRCQMCPKRFSKVQNLHIHQASHMGTRPFTCHICTKTFIRKRELDRHVATHSGMKPFKCNRCTKSFGRKDKMIRHMRIHDISKSFNCPVCGSSFNRRDSLQQHMKVHQTPIGGEDGESVLLGESLAEATAAERPEVDLT